jgi:hypothetical protein
MGEPTIKEVPLGGSRDCWVSRSLWYGQTWKEIYGLGVGGRLFFVSSEYDNQPGRAEAYQSIVFGILSSLSVEDRVPVR